MDSLGDWIVPLIHRCLSFYQKGSNNASLELEDDGSNLRFTNPIERLALVEKCHNSPGLPTLNLTDDKTQIPAILSSDALDSYRRNSPDRPLEQHNPKNYYIRLVAFEVVFEYSTSKPKIHLFVKQFSIDWNRGKIKCNAGKKPHKNKDLDTLMRTVFSNVKQSVERPDTAYSGESLRSQDGRDSRQHSPENALPETGTSQEFLMSQIPSGHHLLASSNIRVDRGPPTVSAELLGRLGPDSNVSGRISLSSDANTQETNFLRAPLPAVMAKEEQTRGGHHASKKTDYHPVPANGREAPTSPITEGTSTRNVTETLDARTEKSFGVTEINTEEPAVNPPETSNQKTVEIEKASSPRAGNIPKQPGAKNPLKQPSPAKFGPWHGLTKIRSRDVKIPKDQTVMLEDHRVWFPPLAGKPIPQAHVPMDLLSHWNRIALRKSHHVLEIEQGPKGPRTEAPNNRESPVNAASPTSQSGFESASERFSWSPSPSNRDPNPRHELPADSPTSKRPRARKSDSPRSGSSISTGNRLPENTETRIHVSNEENQRSISEPPEEHILSIKGQTQINNESKSMDISNPISRAQTQELEDDIGSESNESVMDAAVPCPLGASSQPTLSTEQPEQEPTSSGPSLPRVDTHENVQVVETPGADLNRLRSEKASNGNFGGLEQRSSQAAKSSSQSRIFNTYDNNDSASKSSLSQRPHYSSQTNGDSESNGVDVMNTQISSGSWPIQDTTPNSHSAFIPNSSGPNVHEPSVPLPASGTRTERTLQPFFSYRDVPMFPSDDENLGPSFQSPAREASIGHTLENIRAPGLKRVASVMEIDEPSPPKRQKIDHGDQHAQLNRIKGPNIMSRRQSYIGSAAKRAEAMQVYEKFRTDYPSYTGELVHFIELCSKLQILRDKGNLKRSFLWDDFIIMHLEQYPSYRQLCLEMETEPLEYEQYFSSHFSKPTCKKRSLTTTGIEVSAAQHVAMTGATTSPFAGRGEANASFTTGLVDGLSNFHAHSFGPEIKSNRSDTEDDPISDILSSSTPHARLCRSTSVPIQRAVDEPPIDRQSSTESSHQPPVDEPVTDTLTTAERLEPGTEPFADDSASREPAVDQPVVNKLANDETMDYDSTIDEPAANRQLQIENAQALNIEDLVTEGPASDEAMDENTKIDEYAADKHSGIETTSQGPHPVFKDREDEPEPSIPESEHGGDSGDDKKEEEYDEMEATHETASIELGDEELSTAPPGFLPGAQESETPDEDESVNENWFTSLRHIRPPAGPVWSDDPNTPFKMWARADQNLKTEIRRRGHRHRDVDKNGVIQRSTTQCPR